MPFGSGIGALIRAGAAWELEDGVELETLSIGQLGNSLTSSYELQTAGRWLSYTVNLAGEHLLVSASLLDSSDPPEVLLKAKDNEEGWRVAFHLVAALEKTRVQSLARPIEARIDGDPQHSFVIG